MESNCLVLEDVLDPKLFNHEKYDKNDDLEVLQLGLKIKQYRLPNYMKFPPSSMKRSKRYKRTQEERKNFSLFYSRIIPHVLYKIDDLVKIYNDIFTENPLNSISFGKLKEVKKSFIKCRKRIYGKMETIYVKNS